MKVWSVHEPISIPGPVATIGIFDGVHLGHRFILDRLKESAIKHGGESVVLTLWPHPRIVLNKDLQTFSLLHSREEKISVLKRQGIDHLVIVPFTKELASLDACSFTRQFLVELMKVEVLLLGYDNRFGRDRQGDPNGLALCAEENAFLIEKLPELDSAQGRISSTAIRESLLKGDLESASLMLGEEYFLAGKVVGGSQVGRSLGYPTANIHPENPYKLIPMNGVYAIRAELRGEKLKGMMNIGFRPTLDSAQAVRTIEAHLFDMEEDIYGEDILIHFVKRVRDEMKFSGLEALKTQLQKDEVTIRQVLS